MKDIYNLSDIVRFKRKHGLNFKGSIGYEYLMKQQGPFFDWGVFDHCSVDFQCLQDIVKKRQSQAKKDTFAIHVRAFDCIDKVPDVDVFLKIIKKYNLHSRFRNCMLFYGNHKKGLENSQVKKSESYLKKLKNKIEKLNLTCELVSKSVDEDFISLATAKCYIAGYRGFGWLAASINPNEVIWDIQDPPVFPWLVNQDFKEGLIEGYEFHKSIKSGPNDNK
tara:strand:- start:3045 stop:3707 length:663 start_codon:yes stop_codon:yes gene_type:complete